MKILYTTVFIFFITSCATTNKSRSNFDYIGTSYAVTDSVTVFVDASAIEKPYTIIGKGYMRPDIFGNTPIRLIQAESKETAKKNGADAVLIQDYVLPATDLSSVYHTDSIGKRTVTSGNTTVQQSGMQHFTILFLKYK